VTPIIVWYRYSSDIGTYSSNLTNCHCHVTYVKLKIWFRCRGFKKLKSTNLKPNYLKNRKSDGF